MQYSNNNNRNMRISSQALFLIAAISGRARADLFNYDKTKGDNYGPSDWNKVDCNGLDDCVSRVIIENCSRMSSRLS